MIHQKNEERKEIVQSIYEEAKTMVDPEKKVQVLAKEGWNPGDSRNRGWSFVGRTRADSHRSQYRRWSCQGQSLVRVEAVDIFEGSGSSSRPLHRLWWPSLVRLA